MYPIPAVLVNCGDPRPVDVRAALAGLAVPIAAEFPTADDLLKKWPAPPPDRRVIVARVGGLKQTAALGKLADGFPGWPIVALVDGTPDADGLYAVSRAGAAQLVPFPPRPDDLSLALDRIAVQFALQLTRPRAVAVAGAASGSGATTLAIGLAFEFARTFDLPTTLLELEFGIGRLPGYLNLSPPVSVRDLLAPPGPLPLTAVQAALAPAGGRLFVLAGPHSRVDFFQPPAGKVADLIGIARRLTPMVVLDLPGSFDPVFFEAAAAADRVVLVGRQDVPTVQAMKMVRDGLLGRGVADPVLVLNGFDPDRETFTPARVGGVIGAPPPRTVRADPDAARQAANEGKPLPEVAADSRPAADLRALAGDLLRGFGHPVPEAGPAAAPRRGWVGRLLGRGGS